MVAQRPTAPVLRERRAVEPVVEEAVVAAVADVAAARRQDLRLAQPTAGQC